jgi:hypothetical protein
MDPVLELKVRAEILHHAVRTDDAAAMERLRVLAELRRVGTDALRAAAARVRRKHCLAAVAREAGFSSWEHALRILEDDGHGREPADGDFGTVLYAARCGGHLNHWFASYAEARAFLVEAPAPGAPRYLLAYKRHFFVVDRFFIEAIGLDPDDDDWKAIGWDWARPASFAARRRLYGKVLRAAP